MRTVLPRSLRRLVSPRTLVPALLALAPSVGGAQALCSAAPGTRIRVDLFSTERSRFGRERPQSLVGTLAAVRADTVLLVVRDGIDPVRVPLASTRAAYASGGRPPRWQAALRGAAVQAVVGAALSALSSSIHRGDGDRTPMQMAVSSAAWGAASGAVYGAWSPRERWHRLAYPVAAAPGPVVASLASERRTTADDTVSPSRSGASPAAAPHCPAPRPSSLSAAPPSRRESAQRSAPPFKLDPRRQP
ncbi:MAG TPA: hypothetical protein VFS08_07475 [Gemmatimonadaceae bacterium]|nr:hypothetical protein [Gemmatimonadaceae bacterium]